MAHSFKTCLLVGLLLPCLLAPNAARGCTGLLRWGTPFDPAVGVVAAGEWGEPYPLEVSGQLPVIAVAYDNEPTPAESGPELAPYGGEPTAPPPPGEEIIELDAASADEPLDDEEGLIISLIPSPGGDEDFTSPYFPSEHVLGYNTSAGGLTWIPASRDDFGWFSIEDTATLSGQRTSGLVAAMSFHFLNGPVQTEMPPRLFDFVAGYQRREWIRPNVGWDIALRIGVFSDFEGSADEGMRFPSHLVTFWQLTPALTALAGVDYLDWDEITILPVFGFTWIPTEDYRVDIAFPRPRAAVRIMESETWIAIGGELAGGTWAIERDHAYDDNVTYQDMRVYVALETFAAGRTSSSLELGYVFERDLEYRSGVGNYYPGDAMMIRWTGRH